MEKSSHAPVNLVTNLALLRFIVDSVTEKNNLVVGGRMYLAISYLSLFLRKKRKLTRGWAGGP